ncbi:hypothetical protein MP228_004708 [Amoeboaphelidium protococcarum]|nr:hypothetical protein MP228_004708 [Amoeboaphelidium protococcarum]
MRPEDENPPDLFYDSREAKKYTENSRIGKIQVEMTERALELLDLDDDQPQLILDIGCGSGLSGDVLTEHGHQWIGVDISEAMLDIAVDREVDGDVMRVDVGQGLSFRPGSFDGCISISCLQWLCTSCTSDQIPQKRLSLFFTDLYKILRHGAKAILQVYPDTRYDKPDGSNSQLELMTSCALKCGFGGGLVIDYPESQKKRKYYLCLTVGGGSSSNNGTEFMGLTDQASGAGPIRNSSKQAKKNVYKKGMTRKEWVLHKKEVRRKRGLPVPNDSKYSGRRRKGGF